MKFYHNNYHHLYNRSNNKELLFKENKNYLYFLKQYKKRFEDTFDTIAYCLMPTHFHFLVYCKDTRTELIPHEIGRWLSAYTKAINNRYNRTGSLFQRHTKTILIDDDAYLITLLTYIHQNPLRAGLVNRLEQWPYSSYPDYIEIRGGSLPKKNISRDWFKSTEELKAFSEKMIDDINSKYWI